MKVATKLSGAFGLVLILLVGLLVDHVRTIRSAVRTSYQLSEVSARLYFSSMNLALQLDLIDEVATKYGVTRDSAYLHEFHDAIDAFDTGLRDLARRPLSADERVEIDRLTERWEAFRASAARFGEWTRGFGGAGARLAALQAGLDGLRRHAQAVAAATRDAMNESLDRSAAAARRAERVTWAAAAGALTLSILVAVLITRSIADALNRLKEGTRRVAQGDFDYRLDSRRNDEFAQLARDFNAMNLRLGELDRMKRDFLSKVSHDLKTPLASMRETLHLVLDEVPGPLNERQRRLLAFNDDSGRRLSSMIAKILDLSAMESGTMSLEFAHHDLARLVRQAVDQTTVACGRGGIRVVDDLPATPLLLVCDGDRIAQVLLNLLENAVKFSPPDGVVRIAARVVDQRPVDVPVARWSAVRRGAANAGVACISVTDHGPGVADGDKEAIFERFHQAAAGRTVEGRGVGLGLTICREIVEAHHGTIWVGDAPDAGSVFSVLLPGAATPRPLATAAAPV